MARMLKLALVSAFPPGRQSLNEYGWHLAHALAERPDVAEVVIIADILDDPKPEASLPAKIWDAWADEPGELGQAVQGQHEAAGRRLL